MSLKNLSSQEKSIMFQKATERAFTGEYDKTTETGIYTTTDCIQFRHTFCCNILMFS